MKGNNNNYLWIFFFILIRLSRKAGKKPHRRKLTEWIPLQWTKVFVWCGSISTLMNVNNCLADCLLADSTNSVIGWKIQATYCNLNPSGIIFTWRALVFLRLRWCKQRSWETSLKFSCVLERRLLLIRWSSSFYAFFRGSIGSVAPK